MREGKHQHIAHHGLIKLIVMDDINHLKYPMLWVDFVDMDMEVFIKTQALNSPQQEETLTSSTRGREEKEEERENKTHRRKKKK